MYKFILLLSCMMLTLSLSAQDDEQIKIKKEKRIQIITDEDNEVHKTVTVDVDNDQERNITIKTIKDGEEKVMSWTDDGDIPDDVKKHLEENNIDIQILKGDQKGLHTEDHDVEVEKEIVIIKKNDGETEHLEWNGEGEMPKEIRQLLDEEGIDLSQVRRNGKGKRIKMRRKQRGRRDQRGSRTHHQNVERHKWESPHPKSKTYLGVHLEKSENGVQVMDVIVDSPAHKNGLKSGDIITQVNGAHTRRPRDLMMLISLFDPNDTVEVKYSRGSKSKSTKIKLGERERPARR